MFSGNARFLLVLLGAAGALYLVAQARVFILIVSWAVIALCLWIIYVKRYSRNESLKREIDGKFRAFQGSRFFKFISGLSKKPDEKRKE